MRAHVGPLPATDRRALSCTLPRWLARLPYITPATPPRGHNARRPLRRRPLLRHYNAGRWGAAQPGGRFLASLRSSRIAHKLAPLLRSWRNRDQALLGGSARTLVRSGGGRRAPSAAGRANHLRTREI